WKLLGEISQGDRVLILRKPHDDECEISATDERLAVNLAAVRSSALAPLAGKSSAEKEIPELVWRSPTPFKRAFLQSLFTGDGSCSALPRNGIQITYSTCGEQLARDVQLLLLEFGVISR